MSLRMSAASSATAASSSPRCAADAIGLAFDVVADLRAVGVGVGDALEALARDAFADRGVDAHLGAGGHDAGRRDGEARIERLRPRAGDDDHVLVALHAGRDRPFDVLGVVHVDVVVHHDDVLDVLGGERGEEGVLAFAGLLPDGDDGVPEAAAAERDVDVLHLDAGVLERAAQRGVARRRGEPGVFPRHVQRVVDRVLAPRDRLDLHERVPVQAAHQARELAEAALGMRPAGRQDFGFEHDLGVGDARQVDRLAQRQLDRRAADARRRCAISSTPSGARKPEPMISNGWVPIEIEIGQGRPAS